MRGCSCQVSQPSTPAILSCQPDRASNPCGGGPACREPNPRGLSFCHKGCWRAVSTSPSAHAPTAPTSSKWNVADRLPTCLAHRPKALTAVTTMHQSTDTLAARPSEPFRGNSSRTNEAVSSAASPKQPARSRVCCRAVSRQGDPLKSRKDPHLLVLRSRTVVTFDFRPSVIIPTRGTSRDTTRP